MAQRGGVDNLGNGNNDYGDDDNGDNDTAMMLSLAGQLLRLEAREAAMEVPESKAAPGHRQSHDDPSFAFLWDNPPPRKQKEEEDKSMRRRGSNSSSWRKERKEKTWSLLSLILDTLRSRTIRLHTGVPLYTPQCLTPGRRCLICPIYRTRNHTRYS